MQSNHSLMKYHSIDKNGTERAQLITRHVLDNRNSTCGTKLFIQYFDAATTYTQNNMKNETVDWCTLLQFMQLMLKPLFLPIICEILFYFIRYLVSISNT